MTTYTVRPLGETAWAEAVSTLAEAESLRSEAIDRGLAHVVIVDDETGAIVASDRDDDAA